MSEPSERADLLARTVIGAAIAVHRALGPGYPESVYEEAMAIELAHQGLRYRRQHTVGVFYRDQRVGEGRLDFLVEDALVVELKAVERLAAVHRAQVLAYLKATGLALGLLLNFNEAVLKDGLERIVLRRSL